MNFVGFVQALLNEHASAASEVARLLGSLEPSAGRDPAMWPVALCRPSLPSTFGSDLLTAARLAENGAWTESLEHWPENAHWLDDKYPEEVWRLNRLLGEQLRSHPEDQLLRQQAQRAARALRRLSEAVRFKAVFDQYDRWLKMQALTTVIPLLPDESTFQWVEREMRQPSRLTRLNVLGRLVHLASVDAQRSARVYCLAVGLARVNRRPVLETQPWDLLMGHHAIQGSLAGDDTHPGLIREHPVEFMPVAIDLAEALWESNAAERSNSSKALEGFIEQILPGGAGADTHHMESPPPDPLGDLIDDAPDLSFRHHPLSGEPGYDCLCWPFKTPL